MYGNNNGDDDSNTQEKVELQEDEEESSHAASAMVDDDNKHDLVVRASGHVCRQTDFAYPSRFEYMLKCTVRRRVCFHLCRQKKMSSRHLTSRQNEEPNITTATS